MERIKYRNQIDDAFKTHPVVALLGPRQCGKTTLARMIADELRQKINVTYFDLEDPRDLARLKEPMLVLEELTGLIIIDEIQRIPDLFMSLRVLVDQKKDRKFLILGSASRDLIKQSSLSPKPQHPIIPPSKLLILLIKYSE